MKAPYLKKLSKIEHLKKGKRLYGAFWTLPSGAEIYVAYRKRAEIFRGGEKSIGAAVRKDCASWALDVDTLREIDKRGIAFVGVLVRETEELYVTALDRFYSDAAVMNYEKRGGAMQRYLPLTKFKKSSLRKL